MNVLILHPGALGDLILALPAISLLRSHFPQAAITLAGHMDFLEAIASGSADRVRSLGSLPIHRLFSADSLESEDCAYWGSFDRIVSWTGSGDGNFVRKLARANPATLFGSWKPAPGETRHVSQIFSDTLIPWLGTSRRAVFAGVRLDPSSAAAGKNWLARQGWVEGPSIVAVHPGAGGTAKRWPLERYRELARALEAGRSVRLLVVEGPAERGLGAELAAGLAGFPVCTAASLPLTVLAGVLSRCRAFVGNDSGIAHLAAGLGLPSLVLFGPTEPEHWAPLGNRVTTLRHHLGCLGCREPGGYGHTCMEAISVEEATSRLLPLLE